MSPKLIIGTTLLSIRISIAPFYILMHYTSLRRLCTSLRKQYTRHCEEFRVARYEAIPEILWQSTPTVKVVHHKYRHCEEFGGFLPKFCGNLPPTVKKVHLQVPRHCEEFRVARYEAILQILWQSIIADSRLPYSLPMAHVWIVYEIPIRQMRDFPLIVKLPSI